MATNAAPQTMHYRAGEMVVVAELPDDEAQHPQAHGVVQQAVEQSLAGRAGGVFSSAQRNTDAIVFRAPGRRPLGFLFYDLAEPNTHALVKDVVEQTQARDLAALERIRGSGLSPVGVMPHWLGSAQDNYSDGSPATLPRPIGPEREGRFRYRYTPNDEGLDFRAPVSDVDSEQHVPVLVLDTMPNWADARRQAAEFASGNPQLAEMVDVLSSHPLPDWHAQALQRRDDEGIQQGPTADGRARAHDESDHGLFISGLIRDLAPGARLSLRPVLNRFGVGDLHLLLRVLEEVVRTKRPDEPLVINMSLGFAPKLEHLPWIWSGVSPGNDPDFVPDVPIPGEQRDRPWLASNQAQIRRTTHLLHSGLDRLNRYLLANNCLGVAAVGNDSYNRVKNGRPRLGPRVPAVYESVLGVGATTKDPRVAAPYSNIGDVLEFGDHISTFGGGMTGDDQPDDGVIGVYSARQFPAHDNQTAPTNNTGWAMWSGTSFATGIASGLVAAYWTHERKQRPETHAEAVLAGFGTLVREYTPALRTPAIGMHGEWLRDGG